MSATTKAAAACLVGYLVFGDPCCLHADEGSTKSNAEVMSDDCWQAVEKFFVDAKVPDTSAVSVEIGSGEANSFFAPVVIQVMHQHSPALYSRRAGTPISISVSVGSVKVVYGEPFSEGIFSARRCSRTIEVDLRFAATRNEDGRVLWSGMETSSHEDTVSVSDIRTLEKSSSAIAGGTEPAPSVWERLLEPVIIGGAAGVAVYLFFTIRS